MTAHIELYDDEVLDDDEDLFTFNKKPIVATAWERSDDDGGEREDEAADGFVTQPRRPAAPRSAYSAAPTDDEDWLAPDTPSPNKAEEEGQDDNHDDVNEEDAEQVDVVVDGDALGGLLEMAEEEEARADGGDGGDEQVKQHKTPATRQAWGAGAGAGGEGGKTGDEKPNAQKKRIADASASAAAKSATTTTPRAAATHHHRQQQQQQPNSGVDHPHHRQHRRRPAVAENATQLEVNDWIADAAVLRNKQKIIEARDPRLAPEIEVIAKHGGAAASAEQDDLRRELMSRLRRIRSGVTILGHHVCNIRPGPEYVSELGRMMDGAEKDILALKEAQRTAFDALMREERELTRHAEDFAARIDVWDSDKSDPTWAEASTSAATASSKGGGVKRRPGSAVGGTAGGVRGGSSASLEPWARAAVSNSPSKSSSSPSKKAGGAAGAHAHANRPPPQAVQDYDDFMESHGSTGGWADVDHARWRRCLSRANMNYGAAVLLAADELAAFGIERQEVIRHARWDAEREDLLIKKKAAVQRWRSKQQEAAAAHREALASESKRAEEALRAKQAAEAAAARAKEKEALKEWRERKRVAEEAGRMAKEAAREIDAQERAERARALKRERAERDARNALRQQARAEAAERARVEAEAAAAALIPSGPPASAAEKRAERERLAAASLAAATKRREAAAAKDKALDERKARQVAAAERLAAKRRLAQGKPAEVAADPTRLTRATKAHTSRVESDKGAGPLFDTRPAVMYLQHRATPSWRARS